jgi:hypothetical protein
VNWFVATGQRVLCEQLPQRGIVADRHRSDQLIVVHRFSIAFRRQQVHQRRKLREHPQLHSRIPPRQTSMSGDYHLPRRARPARRLPLTMPSAVTRNRPSVRPPSLTIGP